jgi:hypothetical protein
MKTIIALRSSTPEKPEFGWGDHVRVVDETGADIYGGHFSTCPNPYQLNSKGDPIPWQLCYAMICDGEYSWECIYNHKRFGKCLLINNGEAIPTINANKNHNNEKIATEIFIHRGAMRSNNQKWRGSKGCLTLPPEESDSFFSLFTDGEKGKLTIKKLIG